MPIVEPADVPGDLLDHPLVRIRAGDVADLDTVTGVELVGSVLESGGERPLDAHRRLGAGDLEVLPFGGLERALDTGDHATATQAGDHRRVHA